MHIGNAIDDENEDEENGELVYPYRRDCCSIFYDDKADQACSFSDDTMPARIFASEAFNEYGG